MNKSVDVDSFCLYNHEEMREKLIWAWLMKQFNCTSNFSALRQVNNTVCTPRSGGCTKVIKRHTYSQVGWSSDQLIRCTPQSGGCTKVIRATLAARWVWLAVKDDRSNDAVWCATRADEHVGDPGRGRLQTDKIIWKQATRAVGRRARRGTRWGATSEGCPHPQQPNKWRWPFGRKEYWI